MSAVGGSLCTPAAPTSMRRSRLGCEEARTRARLSPGRRKFAGWDNGIAGMCVGEKRKLKIPSDMGYGDRGSPPKIPGGATLIFTTELMGINGVKTQR